MNEPLENNTDSDTHVTTQQEVNKNHKKSRLYVLWALLVVLVFGVSCYSIYLWQHQKVDSANARVAELQNELKTTKPAATSSQSDKQRSTTVTETLTNGTKIGYPLTPQTANIMWWSQEYYDMTATAAKPNGYMVLSDKLIPQFLSTVPSEDLSSICGNKDGNFNDVDIAMNIFNPSTKVLSHNQYANCIQLITGSNTKYANGAKQVLAKVTDDILAFTKVVTVNE